jgi:hypothetical protein
VKLVKKNDKFTRIPDFGPLPSCNNFAEEENDEADTPLSVSYLHID